MSIHCVCVCVRVQFKVSCWSLQSDRNYVTDQKLSYEYLPGNSLRWEVIHQQL